MPRMLPRQPDADAPMSEQQVFEAFREGLPDDWVVLHSRRFLLPAPNGRRPQEGEIDFLVLDPARGLLALEVKGGEVQCQGGEWTSIGTRSHSKPRTRGKSSSISSSAANRVPSLTRSQ